MALSYARGAAHFVRRVAAVKVGKFNLTSVSNKNSNLQQEIEKLVEGGARTHTTLTPNRQTETETDPET